MGKITKNWFHKLPRKLLNFLKTGMHVISLLYDSVLTSPSRYIQKRMSFTILNVKKVTFHAIPGNFTSFLIFKFRQTGIVHKCFGVIFAISTQNDLKIHITPPKIRISGLTFLTF